MKPTTAKPYFQIPETGPVRPAEAAAYLRIARCTLYAWAAAGRLTIHKGGPRTSYIRAEELRRLAGEVTA
jgi:excisionase family DNA binding protein